MTGEPAPGPTRRRIGIGEYLFRVLPTVGSASIVAAAGVLIGASVLDAQEERRSTAKLVGTVISAETRAPLTDVTVEVPEEEVRGWTDARGRFVLLNLPAGEHTVRFRLLGHEAATEEVRLEAGETGRIDVRLESRAIEISPVTVRAQRERMLSATGDLSDLPGSAQVITRSELEGQALLADDIHTVLRQVPGVNVQEEEGYGLRPNIGLRGTGTERSSKITVMEDGVLIAPAPYASPSAYYFPVVGRMDAVEVRKGTSQLRYGPRTVGGALNLVSTPIPETLTLEADLEGGEDNTRKIRGRVGDSYDHLGWQLEGYGIGNDGFKNLDAVGDPDTGFDVQDYVGKIRVNSDPEAERYQEFELKLHYYDETSNETYLGLTESDFRQTPNRRYAASREDVMNAEQRSIQGRYFLQLSEWADVSTTLYRNEFERNWFKLQSVGGTGISSVLDRPDEFAAELAILKGAESEADALEVRANAREYFAQGIQTAFGLRFGEQVSHDVEVGIRYHEDEEDRFQHEDGFRMSGGSMILTSPGAPGSQANRVVDAQAWSLHAVDRIELGRFTFTPGLRYENVDLTRTDYATDDPERTAPERVRNNSVDIVLPGAGISYAALPGLHLFGGVHRGFGPPGPGADDRTESEKSVNYELGVRFNRSGLQTAVTGFFSDYSNILGRSTLGNTEEGTGEAFNGGDVDVWGLEVSAQADAARILSDRWFAALPVTLAYTFTDAEFQTAFESDFGPWGTVEVGDELPYLASHQVYASVGLEASRWGATLAAMHNSQMRTKAGQGPIPVTESTDAFLVLNVSARYRVTPWSQLFVGIENLTDKEYVVARRPAGARPGLPRSLVGGVKIRR